MSNGNIVNALNKHLIQFDSQAYKGKIDFENSGEFSPPDGMYFKIATKFYEPKMIGAGVEGQYRVQGIYLIQILVPRGRGTAEGLSLATELVNWFYRGRVLTEDTTAVKIESSHQYSLEEGPNYLVVPVAVKFWTYMNYTPS